MAWKHHLEVAALKEQTMGQLTLTRQDIELDIHQYHERIRSCRDRLATMPEAKDQSRRDKATVRVIASEVSHLFRMVEHAKSALHRL